MLAVAIFSAPDHFISQYLLHTIVGAGHGGIRPDRRWLTRRSLLPPLTVS